MGSSLRSLAGAPYHLISGIAYALRRSARRRADESAVADAAWSRSRGGFPEGLALTWLGTSGFRIGYAGTTILVDPYFTRVPLGALTRAAAPQYDARLAPEADAILVGHTHFDHAMDAPVIAAALRCPVYGSESLAHLMALHGVAELAVPVIPRKTYAIGPFEISFHPSQHSKLALGLWTPADGELSCEHLDDLTPQRYRCGQVWGIRIAVAGVTLYHQGSCDLVEDEVPRGVDYLLAGIAGRRFTRHYVSRILKATDARVVIPHHWDDFFRPIDAPVGFSLNVNVAGFLDEVAAVTRDVEVRTIAPFEEIGG